MDFAEFEQDIQAIIDGKMSKRQLCKKLKMGSRTLNQRILELSVTNPNLYKKIITVCPYRSKERHDIDFEALIIYILKRNITLEQASEGFNISESTIKRHVRDMKKTNLPLAQMYYEDAQNKKLSRNRNLELSERIDSLIERPVILSNQLDSRISYLQRLKNEYENRCKTYGDNNKAAESLGYNYEALRTALKSLPALIIQRDTKNDILTHNVGRKERTIPRTIIEKTDRNFEEIDY